ncbi:MAG: type II toxin-antitoxin system HigB family toxin [Gemmatimonadaceae bacterium]
MHVISRKALLQFGRLHRDAVMPLDDWYRITKKALWKNHHDVKAQFGTVSIVRDCAVFNIAGNKYRLIVWIKYAAALVLVRGIMTHREYDKSTLGLSAAAIGGRQGHDGSSSLEPFMTAIDFSMPRVLRNEREYEAALAEVERLLRLNSKRGSLEFDRLELLTLLIEAYEDERYPMGGTSTPQSVVEFMLDQKGMTRADLTPILGSRGRVSEFFTGKRRLSITQMLALRDVLGLSLDLLVEPEPASGRRRRRA